MASKTYRIESHWVAVGPGITVTHGDADLATQGYIASYGSGERLLIYFMEDPGPSPPHTYDEETGVAAIFVPLTAMPSYLGILVRGEVYAYVNSDSPQWNCIKTSPGEMAAEKT
ncbi:hypothetical protein L6R50_13145 [Myxococcota bacterium]|nr:hypothetical protein [Myxococcota bacterium]